MKFLLFLFALPLFAQNPNWFNITNGDTTCRASTVQTSPFRFTYYCGNPRGATAGSWTADPSNTATDSLTVGLSGLAPGTLTPGGTICQFAMNMTANPVTMGSFGLVPAGSVYWQCSAFAQGTGTQPVSGVQPIK